MAKRKGKSTNISSMLFDDVNPYGAVIGQTAVQPETYMPLDLILPDPNQPRQLLPNRLHQALYDGSLTPTAVMTAWLQQTTTGQQEATTATLPQLRQLANSIAQHGLINPVTVRPATPNTLPPPATHIIVTGERRYWAHILLQIEGRLITEGEIQRQPDEIKASLTAAGVLVRAHQIIENLMREDINVIEKAHGLWALRYELSYDAYRRHSAANDAPATGQPDDDAYRRHSAATYPEDMPLVAWRQVEEALDMSRQYRARIINVLKLSEAAQQLIHEHDLAEATIRPVVDKLRENPELQLTALRQLLAWQQEEAAGDGGRRIVPSLKVFVDGLLQQADTSDKQPVKTVPTAVLAVGRLRQKIRGTTRFMSKMTLRELDALAEAIDQDTDRDQIVEELTVLRQHIDTVLSKADR